MVSYWLQSRDSRRGFLAAVDPGLGNFHVAPSSSLNAAPSATGLFFLDVGIRIAVLGLAFWKAGVWAFLAAAFARVGVVAEHSWQQKVVLAFATLSCCIAPAFGVVAEPLRT